MARKVNTRLVPAGTTYLEFYTKNSKTGQEYKFKLEYSDTKKEGYIQINYDGREVWVNLNSTVICSTVYYKDSTGKEQTVTEFFQELTFTD